MARTVIGLNDPKAIRRQSVALATEVIKKSYWTQRFWGRGEETQMPIMERTELRSNPGASIDYNLSLALRMAPIEGDDPLSGATEPLAFRYGELHIDEMRQGVDIGSRMTRKRTLYNLREIARARSRDWWSRAWDEVIFCYVSGARGHNTGWLLPEGWAGRAGNPLRAPDAYHHYYGGGATSSADITAADQVTLRLIEFTKVKAETMGGGTQRIPRITPISIDGGDYYVYLMDKWSSYNLRNAAGAGTFAELQRAMAGALGRDNHLTKGGLGMYAGVVLHEHENVIRFTDGGVGGDVEYARNLFLGRHAAVIAFGNGGSGQRFDWSEESRDHKSKIEIGTHCSWGCTKARYGDGDTDANGLDHGVMVVDVASEEAINSLP